ncbi:hypothetical protein L248_2295 [Schleiferilactobacillus shenzhenensis LY-73]|uniref:Uncharacterized protein n=1 Tax=Schleiferilactobacillus shenzhenensis LY-73 TaxID=1231336 RepID=U4TN09_9LACO|nr:hypothetical protein L248_2295 [Schleiferilactobacillus shenzhenensis LY-73]
MFAEKCGKLFFVIKKREQFYLYIRYDGLDFLFRLPGATLL